MSEHHLEHFHFCGLENGLYYVHTISDSVKLSLGSSVFSLGGGGCLFC
jgi:hypothetical protein